jgi:hypothetical protein
MVAGMSSAILQGVPATTLDTDLWIDLPERQYIRLTNLSLKLGATLIRTTAVALRDGALVNYLYRVDVVRKISRTCRSCATSSPVEKLRGSNSSSGGLPRGRPAASRST